MDETAAVDEHIAAIPEPHRSMLEHVRALIHESRPGIVEVISYGMPAFELGGRKLVWFASFKRHCSIYPASGRVMEVLGPALEPFVAAKATIRFSADRPIPDDLVRRLVAVRAAEVAGEE